MALSFPLRRPCLGVLAGLFLFASGGWAQAPTSAHWKSVISSGPGQSITSIIDTKSDSSGKVRVHSVVETGTGRMVTLVAGDTIYTWGEGQSAGMKTSLANAKRMARGAHGPQASEYTRPDFLKEAKKLGAETVEGELCDKYELTREDITSTVWLSRSKKFPVKLVSGALTVLNRDIEIPSKLSDAAFDPPNDVTFTDMGEMMRQMQEGRPKE